MLASTEREIGVPATLCMIIANASNAASARYFVPKVASKQLMKAFSPLIYIIVKAAGFAPKNVPRKSSPWLRRKNSGYSSRDGSLLSSQRSGEIS
jgi:hypothetical protein